MLRNLYAAFFICGGLLVAPGAAADDVADNNGTPVGSWMRADGKTVFTIETCATGLCGRIAGITLDHPTDPQPMDWRGAPICGDQIITVTPEMGARNQWHGTIVNPRNGNVWQANLTLVNGTLQLRGYFGISLFGQTETWVPFYGQIGANCQFKPAG